MTDSNRQLIVSAASLFERSGLGGFASPWVASAVLHLAGSVAMVAIALAELRVLARSKGRPTGKPHWTMFVIAIALKAATLLAVVVLQSFIRTAHAGSIAGSTVYEAWTLALFALMCLLHGLVLWRGGYWAGRPGA